ncbi:MAG: helix-turn-helix domain-containing protein, partial [Pseudohongiellaceae bacterium]
MKIAFAVCEQALMTGIALPLEMFYAASRHRVRHRRHENLTLQVVGESDSTVLTGGLRIVPDTDFERADLADLVFVPPLWGTPWKVLQSSQSLQRWLAKQYQAGARLAATGTGVGHLAEAGLLGGRVATTHWYYLDRFARRYPDIRFEGHHFVTHDEGIYCAGSINSQTDLVLFLIEQTFGEDALALVERQFMHELKRTFSTPYFEPGGAIHHDEGVSLVQSWVRQHLADDITVDTLAGLLDQSVRNFSRRFSQATGESPMEYLQRLRLEHARELLRDTNL